MTEDEKHIAKEAILYVKQNRKEIVERFASDQKYSPVEQPNSLFMAGSPGAGKTEFSKRLIEILEHDAKAHIVRIDPDDIRNMLPGYTGKNSDIFQAAVSIGVEKLHDYVLARRKHFILDGTLSNLSKAEENVRRSLAKDRGVVIIYVYQDPILSWKFTKAREKVDGRFVPKESFIQQFFAARENVNTLKGIFREKIDLWVVKKNFSNDVSEFHVNVDDVDRYITIPYTSQQLSSKL